MVFFVGPIKIPVIAALCTEETTAQPGQAEGFPSEGAKYYLTFLEAVL